MMLLITTFYLAEKYKNFIIYKCPTKNELRSCKRKKYRQLINISGEQFEILFALAPAASPRHKSIPIPRPKLTLIPTARPRNTPVPTPRSISTTINLKK